MKVSNPTKVIFPDAGYTKADLVGHYRRVAPAMLPHVAGRPLTLQRFPNGIAGKGFLQKNAADYFPQSIERITVPKRDGVTRYPVIRDAAALEYLANLGTVTFHTWASRAEALDLPDRVVFDLDPREGDVDEAVEASLLVKRLLDDLGLLAAPMTTGSKGYHVVVPIVPNVAFARVSRFAQGVAALLSSAAPAVLTDEFKIERRTGRVFVDWLRNTSRATSVTAWSLRARPTAPVAVPIPWDELTGTPPQHWTLESVGDALDRPDPIAALAPVDLGPALDAVDELLEDGGIELKRFDRFRS